MTLWAAVLLATGLAACGPSFQAVYEGNARFEHCYALEENPQEPMPTKAACWRDWSERYTYGQTRDRIHYATARYVALSQAPSLPTDEALMMAAPGEAPRLSSITAPAPTNAFAPPPKVLEAAAVEGPAPPPGPSEVARVPVHGVDAGAPSDAAGPPTLPAASCMARCANGFRECSANGECTVDANTKRTKSCEACPRTYRLCMRNCFK